MDEYFGCKLESDYYNTTLKFTQLMLLKRFGDEFDLPREKIPKISAPDGDTLMKVNPDEAMNEKDNKVCRYGVGKLL